MDILSIVDKKIADWYLNNDVDTIKKALECGFNMLNKPSILSKGSLGEDCIIKILLDSGYVLEDSHKQKASGDIIILINNKRILVEIKNYSSTVPKIELDKFYRDVNVSNVDGGIFISLCSKIKREINQYHFEFYESKPIILLSEILDSDIINISIKHIKSFFDYSNKTIENDNIKKINNILINFANSRDIISRTRNELLELSFIVNKKIIKCSSDLYNIENSIELTCKNIEELSLKEQKTNEYLQPIINKNIKYIKNIDDDYIQFIFGIKINILKSKSNITISNITNNLFFEILNYLRELQISIKIENNSIGFSIDKNNVNILDFIIDKIIQNNILQNNILQNNILQNNNIQNNIIQNNDYELIDDFLN